MARIATDEPDRLRSLDLVRLIEADGLALKQVTATPRTGSTPAGRCAAVRWVLAGSGG
jgi:hypothetical protein